MKAVTLRPMSQPTRSFAEVEVEIKRVFLREVYQPLLRSLLLPKNTFKNSLSSDTDEFRSALEHGTVTYSRGTFSGKFSAGITRHLRRIGAKWNRGEGTFGLPMKEMSGDTRRHVLASSGRFGQKLRAIDAQLGKVFPEELADKFFFSKTFDTALDRVHKDFQDNVGNLIVAPTLTERERNKISEEWQGNLRLHIKGFAKEEIGKLRDRVRETVERGDRYGSLVKAIQESYSVTANKAKFLARQETKLMTNTYHEARLSEIGVDEYYWKSVTGTVSHPVRPRHKALNDASDRGAVFRFSDPPVTSEPGQPERRNNPGHDFNCRCRAIPIIKFAGAAK